MPLKRPTTTPLPDEIYDEWAPLLGEAELKVLLYIVRRTLGFGKGSDAISLTQFLGGIVTRDGRVLDHGCGVKSRPNVIRALKGLEDKGLIRASRARTAAGDKDATVYALLWDADEQPGTIEGSVEKTRRWCRNDQEVVSEQNHGSVAATPTTNSVSTHRQQDRMPTRESPRDARRREGGDQYTPVQQDMGQPCTASDPLWQAVLTDLQETMTAANYTAWLAATVAEPRMGTVLTVRVPTMLHERWLDTKLRSRVEQALRRLGHADIQVVFRTAL